jgi:hypothetical protein
MNAITARVGAKYYSGFGGSNSLEGFSGGALNISLIPDQKLAAITSKTKMPSHGLIEKRKMKKAIPARTQRIIEILMPASSALFAGVFNLFYLLRAV